MRAMQAARAAHVGDRLQLGLRLAHLGATHWMFGGICHAQALAVLAHRRLSLGGTQGQNRVNIRLADAAA